MDQALRIRLCLPSCSPGFDPQVQHLLFFNLYLIVMRKGRKYIKRGRDWPIFKKTNRPWIDPACLPLFTALVLLPTTTSKPMSCVISALCLRLKDRQVCPLLMIKSQKYVYVLYLPTYQHNNLNVFLYRKRTNWHITDLHLCVVTKVIQLHCNCPSNAHNRSAKFATNKSCRFQLNQY